MAAVLIQFAKEGRKGQRGGQVKFIDDDDANLKFLERNAGKGYPRSLTTRSKNRRFLTLDTEKKKRSGRGDEGKSG